MITIIIAPFILTLLYLTIKNKEQRPMNYILIAILIIGIYYLLKNNDLVEKMTNSDNTKSIYTINSKVIAAPSKWDMIDKKEFNQLRKEIINKLGKNYYLKSAGFRKHICPSHIDRIVIKDTDKKDIIWEKIKNKANNNEDIYVYDEESKRCTFLIIEKKINWTELPIDNNLYSEFDNKLRGKYGVTVTKIFKGDLTCNKTPQFVDNLEDHNLMKKIIGTHGFFYYINQTDNKMCYKIELKSNPKNNVYKIRIMNKLIFLDKLIPTLKSEYDDCNLNIVEKLEPLLQKIGNELKSKKIDRELLKNNSYLEIEEDADNKILIINFNHYSLKQQIIENLKSNFDSTDLATEEELKKIECLTKKFNFKPVKMMKNEVYSITKKIKGIFHLNGITYILNNDDILGIPAPNSKGISKINLIIILKLQNAMSYPEKSNFYFINQENFIYGVGSEYINIYKFDDWKKNKIKKDKKEFKIKYIANMIAFNEDNKLLNKKDETIKSVEEVLKYPLNILSMGFYSKEGIVKDFIITKEDVYYLYDKNTDIYSEGKLSQNDLNINFRSSPYVETDLKCSEYGAVLGDLVRNQMIDSDKRNNLLKNQKACKLN